MDGLISMHGGPSVAMVEWENWTMTSYFHFIGISLEVEFLSVKVEGSEIGSK